MRKLLVNKDKPEFTDDYLMDNSDRRDEEIKSSKMGLMDFLNHDLPPLPEVDELES